MKPIFPAAAPRPVEPRRLILYVEDDADNRQVASMRLEKRYELLFAASDKEACEILIARGSDLAIILMDIELKGSRLNGLELTRLIRGQLDPQHPLTYAIGLPKLDTPILFVTAYGEKYRRAELLAAGADEIIPKPVDFTALHTAMARIYLQRLR